MANNIKKLKILYHHRTQGRGAEGKHILSIVKALEQMGHYVKILSPPGVNPKNDIKEAPVDKANVKTTGIKTLWKLISRNLPNCIFEIIEILYNITAYRRILDELKKNNYDIIYERYAFYMIAGVRASKKFNIPFVLEANEVNGIPGRARKQSYKSLCGIFERYIVNNSTGILPVSSYLAEMLYKQGATKEKVIVTPNALDLNNLIYNKKSPELEQKYNLSGNVVVGFAGWFDKWDRLDFLIEVLKEILTKKDVKLLLIGDGPVVEDAKVLAKDYGIEKEIIHTGPVVKEEIYDYLGLLDIAILPHSNNYGSPMIMFEFMGLKIPVVAPKLAPIEDVMKNGETSILFKPLDINDCRDAINTLLNDEEKRKVIAENAYAKLKNNHSWQDNARNILIAANLQ